MKELASKFLDSKTAVTGLFLVVAISLMFNTLKVIQRNYELQQQLDTLADEVALIEVENQNLKFNIQYYETDAYLEVEAKRRFNLAEAGEKVILLPKDGDLPQEQLRTRVEEQQATQPQYEQNLDKWRAFLFGGSN